MQRKWWLTISKAAQPNKSASTKTKNETKTNDNSTCNRFDWPVAFEARVPSHRARQLCAFADSSSGYTSTGRRLYKLHTAEGENALLLLTTGQSNTAIGFNALLGNKTGSFNTATGSLALLNNNGTNNTANGFQALEFNATGHSNTANGVNALQSNTKGTNNTANGFDALLNNNGSFNTANGVSALEGNTTGGDNTANGVNALFSNTTGSDNTANGVNALFSNTTGITNTANGVNALQSNTTGSSNTALGVAAGDALTTGSNNIDIGNLVEGGAGESDTIRIGRVGTQTATFIAGINGATVAGAAVVVSSFGQLGVAPSSARFKDAIKPMDKASEAILALKPVTFRYKKEIDPKSIPQFGLVAEDVEKVNPDLVARDEQGKVYTVRYEAVNAMLLNEFLKEHQKVQKLEAALAAINERLKEQDVKIDKVNAKVELTKPAPQMVVDNP